MTAHSTQNKPLPSQEKPAEKKTRVSKQGDVSAVSPVVSESRTTRKEFQQAMKALERGRKRYRKALKAMAE